MEHCHQLAFGTFVTNGNVHNVNISNFRLYSRTKDSLTV